MSREQEIRNIRLDKIKSLQEQGKEPYALKVKRSYALHEVDKSFGKIKARRKAINLAGRIMGIRNVGKLMFVRLYDGTGEFQVVLKRDTTGKKHYDFFRKHFDIGDFAGFRGTLFVTKTKAKSLDVLRATMLSKSLLPLPDAHYGLHDEETRYRKRYLDILMNADVRERFVLRAKVVSKIREYFDGLGFLEIETPVLQNQAGGAMAQTFNTFHNDYDMPMVMRIALELPHKMLMAGGYPGVYEVGKNFRNEGSDSTHIQEFTMLEWYAAYENLETNIKWTTTMLKRLARLTGKDEFEVYDEHGKSKKVSFAGRWPRHTFAELLKKNAKLNIAKASHKDIEASATKWGMPAGEVKKTGEANLLDYIYKKSSRNKIVNPTYVTNYPGDLKPLAAQNADGTAEVAQLIIAGAEITNMYTELVNPVAQRQLLEKQAKFKKKGDAEAMEVDEDFLIAMEHGMPPMTGFGMGIDRLVAIFTEQKNLRDTIFFPIMKPTDKPKKKR